MTNPLFDADPLDQDALLNLLRQQAPEQGSGAVIRKPQIESESVLDSPLQKYWKKAQRALGGDDPTQVMGIGGAMEVPGGGGGVAKALGKLLKKVPSDLERLRAEWQTPVTGLEDVGFGGNAAEFSAGVRKGAATRQTDSPMVYHARDLDTWKGQQFQPGSEDAGLIHFGSHDAAMQRARTKGFAPDSTEVIGQKLKGNFITVPDLGDWSHSRLAEWAEDSGVWTPQEFDALMTRMEHLPPAQERGFWGAELKKKGIDGFRYNNVGEGKYGDVSYAVFDPKNIKSGQKKP